MQTQLWMSFSHARRSEEGETESLFDRLVAMEHMLWIQKEHLEIGNAIRQEFEESVDMADLEIGRESKILSSSTASRPSKVIKYRGLRTAHQGQEEVRERPKERPVSAGPGRDKGCTTSGPGDLELLGSWIWKTTSVSREGEWHLVSLCALNRVFQQSKCAYNARATGGQTPAQLDCRQPHIDCSQEGCAVERLDSPTACAYAARRL